MFDTVQDSVVRIFISVVIYTYGTLTVHIPPWFVLKTQPRISFHATKQRKPGQDLPTKLATKKSLNPRKRARPSTDLAPRGETELTRGEN